MRFASQITHGNLDGVDGTVTVDSGNDVEVVGFILSNIGAGANRRVLVQDNDSTTFMNIELDQGTQFVFRTPFIAHQGIKFVNGSGDVSDWFATCWHSSAGGGHGEDFVAPKYSYQAMDTTTFTIENGNPIKVYGIYVSNGGDSQNVAITLRDNDSNTIHIYEVDASANIQLDVPFMADNGLEIVSGTSDAEISVTVFHSNAGV